MNRDENIYVVVRFIFENGHTEVYARDTLEAAQNKARQEMNVLAIKNGSQWEVIEYGHWANQFNDWFKIFKTPVLSRRHDQ